MQPSKKISEKNATVLGKLTLYSEGPSRGLGIKLGLSPWQEGVMTPRPKADEMLKKAFVARLRQQADLMLGKLRNKRGFQGISIGVLPEFADAQPPHGWYIAVYADPKRISQLSALAGQDVRLLDSEGNTLRVPIQVMSLTDVRIEGNSSVSMTGIQRR